MKGPGEWGRARGPALVGAGGRRLIRGKGERAGAVRAERLC